jgi:type II secretory ATPase GspE/PulE/Tfp pilus assembly ATPase PilB-like protein
MTDLSMPLQWPPAAPAGADAHEKAQAEAFRWPTPPYPSYPGPIEQHASEPCEIEGLNGNVMQGRLTFFLPEEQVAHVQVPPARTTMPLRFHQFRSLRVGAALPPEEGADDGSERGELLRARPRTAYRIHWADGTTAAGETIGHVETPHGLFLFPPADDRDAVRRVFVPRAAYGRFDIGLRIGELLVDGLMATAEQVEQAAELQQQMRSKRLGDILVTQQVITREQLHLAIEQQSRMPMMRIGEALMALGLLNRQQLDEALETQQRDRSVPLGELLVRMDLISRQDLQTALARKMGYPLVDVRQFPVDTDALKKVPPTVAGRLRALPLMAHGASLVVAVDDPGRRGAIDEIEFVAQCKVVPVLAQHGELIAAIRAGYARLGADPWSLDSADPLPFDGGDLQGEDAGRLVESLEREQHERLSAEDDKPIEQSDNSLVRLINQMIVEAHAQGVSDIHIESYPGRDKVKIRFRKDGILSPYLELPHTYRNAVIARIKIMCDLDISEKRKPQDGKINFARFSPQHRLELRVATIPTNNGAEDVVMRLLTSARPLPLDRIGLSPRNFERLKSAVERPYGMVLCVGPTGSGKTTTLHSALSHINVPERKIWTAEDPVEITQPGLRQVQVNPKIDWTFAKALRAFLRADPDVIMVGEVRDTETAQTAIEASLTGHLVLSTLHTNNAPETVTRLLDMGMDPFNFADALLAVLAQRLVRRLCNQCRTARPATPDEIDEWAADWLHALPESDPLREPGALQRRWIEQYGRDGQLLHHHAPGCPACNHTGLKGRIAIHELMLISRQLRHLIQTGARAEDLQRVALAEGMLTLRQDGIEKVLQGLTSIDEVRATSNV